MTIRLKFWDWIALILSIAAAAVFTVYFFLQSAGPAQVQIETEKGLFIYPLNVDRSLVFDGPVGHTEVRIAHQAAWVEDSDCANKLCVAMGHVSHAGEWVACLPNRVFLRITGGSEEGVDAKAF